MPPRLVRHSKLNGHPSTSDGNQGLSEGPRYGMADASSGLHDDFTRVLRPYDSRWMQPLVSIVVCTYGRPESLDDCLVSLSKQTYRNYEIIMLSEKGDLAVIRQRGLTLAKGDYVSFIDDDVYCTPTWLQSVVQAFQEEGVLGVTGPTTITEEFQGNRDSLKFKTIKRFHDWFFKVDQRPGYLSSVGAPSFRSNYADCAYEGPVQYLECCNFSVNRKEAINVGGFNSIYYRTSEWCEVDLALKLRRVGTLTYKADCKLYHRPSQAGVYKERISTEHRWRNFVEFQNRWVKPSFRRHLYWGFVWAYLRMKSLRMI